MKSICNNLENLTKFPDNTTPALSQGIKFKNYQSKISEYSNKDSDSFVEGFGVIEGNTPRQQSYYELKKDYDDTKTQYDNLMNTINNERQNYFNRINNNPYAGKNIRFTSGHVCYVTEQGVVKWIPNMDTWNSLKDNNGCPSQTYTDVQIKYPDIDKDGTKIPELNLILGKHMKKSESCGNAGKNVYVNSLLNNPKEAQETYVGCYNARPPTKDELIVPLMNNTNTNNNKTRTNINTDKSSNNHANNNSNKNAKNTNDTKTKHNTNNNNHHD